ncbi:MAG: hypothetical protein Q9163_004289 [Psora crenata]
MNAVGLVMKSAATFLVDPKTGSPPSLTTSPGDKPSPAHVSATSTPAPKNPFSGNPSDSPSSPSDIQKPEPQDRNPSIPALQRQDPKSAASELAGKDPNPDFPRPHQGSNRKESPSSDSSQLVPSIHGQQMQPANPVLTIAGQMYTAAMTGFTVGNQTVEPDGVEITLGSTVVSLGREGDLLVGGATMTMLPSEPARPSGENSVAGKNGIAQGTGGIPIFTGEVVHLVVRLKRVLLGFTVGLIALIL